jgi:hypothetical protein
MSSAPFSSADRRYPVRAYNRRMARRVARRANVAGEGAVAVAFAYNSLATMVVLGLIEDLLRWIPVLGAYIEVAFSILAFYFHRIVLVTDQNVHVFRDWPFHYPGRLLVTLRRGPGVVRIGEPTASSFMRFIRRGQLTFRDGTIVYHSFIYIRRARYVAQEAGLPHDQ